MKAISNLLRLSCVLVLIACLALPSGMALAQTKATGKKAVSKQPSAAKPATSTKSKAKSKKEDEEPTGPKPWSLRDKFIWECNNCKLLYGLETAEWRIETLTGQPIVDDVGFSITLGDGTVLNAASLGKAEGDREAFKDDAGEGTSFYTTFPPKDGLVVHSSVNSYRQYAFFSVKLSLTNNSDKPIEVAKITPGIVGPLGIGNLSPEAECGARNVFFRGPYPVFDQNGLPLMLKFHDDAKAVTFSLGLMPMGRAKSGVGIKGTGGAWHGEISCVFDPPVRVEPGGKIESDPIWMTTGLLEPSKIDFLYSWVASLMPHPKPDQNDPRCWVTAEAGSGSGELNAAIREWSGSGVSHALVPAGWEGRPGSLEGGAPRFPKNMRKVADDIRAQGLKAGLTVDALRFSGGGDYVATATDGGKWVNLSNPEGHKAAVEHLKKVVEFGFDFYVVQPSDIPNEALKQFNMTRVQANNLALVAMAEAAAGKPVFPSTACAIPAQLDPWLQASACSSRMAEHGMVPGPVGLDAAGAESLDPNVAAAMTFFNGPIEVKGKVSAEFKKQLSTFFAGDRIAAHPLDLAKDAPRSWQVRLNGGEQGASSYSIVQFPGAQPLKAADIEKDGDGAVQVWSASDGQLLDSAAGIPAVDKLTVYGVSPVLPRPMLLGASMGMELLLDDLKSVTWNEEKGILSGIFRGSNREAATAYVTLPQGWVIKSGKAGDTSITKKNVTDRIQFPVKAGGATSFELQFQRAQ